MCGCCDLVLYRCNHLNGPDFDVLETSSTASLSSAYSEPGTFSPPLGSSLSELSDAGSCETFSEYDIKRSKVLLIHTYYKDHS